MEAIILAGGLGDRLRTVVQDVPKPMAPINGRPFLELLFDYWASQGITRFILSVGYKGESINKHFGARHKSIELDYVLEEQPRGTGGGLLLSLKHLHESGPFLIVNGDTFFKVDLVSMRQFHRMRDAEVTIALREVDTNNRYAGVEVNENGKIISFNHRARTSGKALINGGIYWADRAAFSDITLDSKQSISIEEEIYPRMLASRRRVYGYCSTGKFIDIGIPEDYRRAATVLQDE